MPLKSITFENKAQMIMPEYSTIQKRETFKESYRQKEGNLQNTIALFVNSKTLELAIESREKENINFDFYQKKYSPKSKITLETNLIAMPLIICPLLIVL